MSPDYVYFILFILLLVEGVGIPGIPFPAAFLTAGYYIQQGRMSFIAVVLVGALGNLLGNLVGYWIGGMAVPGLLKKFRRGEKIALIWFQRYGPAVVVISRWFGPIRTPTIVCAAAMGMPPGTYAFYSALGALSWTCAWQYACWKGVHLLTTFWGYYRRYSSWWADLLVAFLFAAAVLCFYFLVRGKRARA